MRELLWVLCVAEQRAAEFACTQQQITSCLRGLSGECGLVCVVVMCCGLIGCFGVGTLGHKRKKERQITHQVLWGTQFKEKYVTKMSPSNTHTIHLFSPAPLFLLSPRSYASAAARNNAHFSSSLLTAAPEPAQQHFLVATRSLLSLAQAT